MNKNEKNALAGRKRKNQTGSHRILIPHKPTALYFLPLLFLFGCVKTEYSPTLTEPAKVVDLVYQPSNHGSGLGIGFGSSPQGGMVTTITPISVDVPEAYAVVFQCQHGKFVIQGEESKAKEMWNRLKENQDVTVEYREVYESCYKRHLLVSKKLVKYEFLDAK